MVEITSMKQFTRAKLRASAGKLAVAQSTVYRQYRVTNEEKNVCYRVQFLKSMDGRKWAWCECAGGQEGYVCKHMAAALPIHLEVMLAAEARERGEMRETAPRFSRPAYNPVFDPEPEAEPVAA